MTRSRKKSQRVKATNKQLEKQRTMDTLDLARDRKTRDALPPTDGTAGDPMPDRPSNRLALKRLRNRAEVTAAQCAAAIGKGESAYMRYEDARLYDDHPIPANIIMPLIPILVGKGYPPVKTEELLEISEMSGIQNLLGVGLLKGVPSAPREYHEHVLGVPNLPIKYRVERGTYRDLAKLRNNTYGVAPILPLRSYPQANQWAAVVNDDHGEIMGISTGTILHCVDASVLSQAAMPAGSVVVCLRSRGGDLAEVCLTVVTGYSSRGPTLELQGENREDTTDVLGAALYRYGPMIRQSVRGTD